MRDELSRLARAVGVLLAVFVLVPLVGGCGGDDGDGASTTDTSGEVAAVLHTDGSRTIAYEAERGTRLWELDGAPVVRVWASNGLFLVQSGRGVGQRDSSTGELLWTADLPSTGIDQVSVVDDRIVAIGDGDVQARDFESGQLVWSWSGTAGRHFAFGGGRVLVEDADRRIVALDLDSGRELWRSDAEVDLNYDVSMGPRTLMSPWYNRGLPSYALTEDAMFLYEDHGDDDRDLVVLDASTGEENWRIAGIAHYGVAMVDDTAVVVAREGMAAFSPGGEERWSLEKPSTRATVQSDTLVASAPGVLFGVDASTGALLWETSLDAVVLGLAGPLVIVVSDEQTLALDPGSGDTVWEAAAFGEGGLLAREPGTVTDNVILAVDLPADDDPGEGEIRLMGVDVTSGETKWVQTDLASESSAPTPEATAELEPTATPEATATPAATATPEATRTPVPTSTFEDDGAFVESVMLRLRDLPSGWIRVASDEATRDPDRLWLDDMTGGVGLPECEAVPYDAPLRRVPDAWAEFELDTAGPPAAVIADVSAFAAEADAAEAISAFRSDAMIECLTAIAEYVYGEGRPDGGSSSVLVSIEVTAVPGAETGDEGAAYRVVSEHDAGTHSYTIASQYELVRVGRYLIFVWSIGRDEPPRAHSSAVETLVERVAAGPPSGGPPTPTVAPTAAPVVKETVSSLDLGVGDCFDWPMGEFVGFVTRVDCSDPHEGEVYLNQDYTESTTFPGDAAMEDAWWSLCSGAFESFVGVPYDRSHFEIGGFWPTAGSWADGDRLITCTVHDVLQHKTTGSAAATAE